MLNNKLLSFELSPIRDNLIWYILWPISRRFQTKIRCTSTVRTRPILTLLANCALSVHCLFVLVMEEIVRQIRIGWLSALIELGTQDDFVQFVVARFRSVISFAEVAGTLCRFVPLFQLPIKPIYDNINKYPTRLAFERMQSENKVDWFESRLSPLFAPLWSEF